MDNLDKTGQHYMIDKKLIEFIIDSANLKKSDVVLDIGYGHGELTKELAKRCKVIAVDIEHYDLGLKNVVSFDDNILVSFDGIYSKYQFNKIVSNIPYNISEPLMRKIFKTDIELVVMTVGEDFSKILVDRKNRIGILANALYDVKILKTASPKVFRPSPRVRSAVVSLEHVKPDTVSGIYKQLISLDDKKLKNAFEKILVERTKREIKALTTMPLFSKKLYELDNNEFVLLDKFVNLLCLE